MGGRAACRVGDIRKIAVRIKAKRVIPFMMCWKYSARQGISRRREICFRLVRHISGLYVLRVTREELLKQQLTDEQRKILPDCSALYNRLPPDLKTKLEGLMHVFLHEVAFEVKGFDEVTEEMRICVAAEACVLILGRGYESYFKLKRVKIWKEPLKDDRGEFGGWAGRRNVSLHWDAVLHGMKWGDDNYNVILHEFAHLLDQAEDMQAQSIPVAEDSADRAKWEELLKREYPRIKAAHKARRAHTIDEYALSTEAEFFSCATESFFERPKELKKYNAEIYGIMRDYYGLNPVEWILLSPSQTPSAQPAWSVLFAIILTLIFALLYWILMNR
jgi:Mlc titration factor MtfA (ptsG expression regulator)